MPPEVPGPSVDETENPHRVDWLKVAAGALAAVSSALLLSTLGAAGTILGAALGSVVVSLSSSFYSTGLDASRRRMGQAQAAARRRVGVAQAEVRRAARRGRAGKAHLEHADEELAAAKAELDEAETGPPSMGERLREMPWKRVGLVAGAFFLVAVVAITAFELIAGRPVSSYTGGTDGGGTSFSRFDHGPRHKSPSKSPSPSESASPSKSAKPTESPSADTSSPDATPSEPDEPSQEPTDVPTPEQTPESSPTP